MSAVLRTDSIAKWYGARRVLSGVWFDAPAGAVTALVGRNGEGKSTLLKIAAGWIPADEGFVELAGRRHFRPDPAALAEDGLFFVPVDRSILAPGFTLSDHLDALEARFGPFDRAPVLERLGIAELARVRCGALSGGERRRAHLAVALLRRPACLLLDEPFRGIDPLDAEVVQAELRALAEAGCTVVITGHEMTWTLGVADRVTWVRNGGTQSFPTREHAEADWHFRRDYLGRR